MTWVLTICTEAWLMCGMHMTFEYASKDDCYEARELLIEEKGAYYFKYIVCQPRGIEAPAGTEEVGL